MRLAKHELDSSTRPSGTIMRASARMLRSALVAETTWSPPPDGLGTGSERTLADR
jgi:hypothetical protein